MRLTRMPCLLAVLAIAFPRVAIILLWLFTNFFNGVYHGIIVPVLGFLFLPLTLLAYTYFQRSHAPMTTVELIILFVAVIVDLGLIGGGTWRGRRVD